jgi:hypothetical protein
MPFTEAVSASFRKYMTSTLSRLPHNLTFAGEMAEVWYKSNHRHNTGHCKLDMELMMLARVQAVA